MADGIPNVPSDTATRVCNPRAPPQVLTMTRAPGTRKEGVMAHVLALLIAFLLVVSGVSGREVWAHTGAQ